MYESSFRSVFNCDDVEYLDVVERFDAAAVDDDVKVFDVDRRFLFSDVSSTSTFETAVFPVRSEGETVRHFNAGKLAIFELRAPGHKREDIQVNIISKFCLIIAYLGPILH